MSNRIDGSSGNIQSLQWMQAQRAFGGAGKTNGNAKGFEEISLEDIYESDFNKGGIGGFEPDIEDIINPQATQQTRPNQRPAAEGPSGASQPIQNSLHFDEIKSIAERAGFIGVSNRDIQRAYALGESLLADYRA